MNKVYQQEYPILLSAQYLPPVQYVTKFLLGNVVIEQCENYQKGSYRNRCHLITANGLQRLSIPLKGGKHQQTPIREVQISNDLNWQQQHWRTIQAAYGNAPFYEHYAPLLQQFYVKKWQFLFDFNLELLEFCLKLLKITWQPTFSEIYEKLPEKALDLRNEIHPDFFETHQDKHFRASPYGQVFEEKWGFVANASALDLLFCTNGMALEVLRKSIVE